MDFLFTVDWRSIFIPTVSPIELFIRGTLVYLVLFLVLRFLPSRQIGTVGITDLLVVILFANAAQNAMASSYTALSDGFILVGTILFWSFALNWLGYKFPPIQHILTPPPLLLVRNGRLLRRNMQRELITQKELMLQIRKQGIEKLDDIKMAFIEADGSISIITHNPQNRPTPSKPHIS